MSTTESALRRADRVGFAASALCAVHCALLPLALALLPAFGLNLGGWIDFDAGTVLSDGIEPPADALFDLILATASGQATAAERNDEREIAIWKRGVTL